MTSEQKKQYLKEYHAKNKERISAQRKQYREENREKVSEQKREYAARNKEKLRLAQAAKYKKYKSAYLLKMKEKYESNTEEIKKRRMDYYYKNRDAILSAQKLAKSKNPEKTRAQKAAYCRKRRANDPKFLLIGRMRCRINDALRLKKFPKTGKTKELLGCDMETLKDHIESMFVDGMNWENRSQWHIDHIVPISSAKTLKEIILLFHYKNLQPLWGADNLSKGCKLIQND